MIFQNLSGYDSHLFIKKLKAKCEDKNEKISCIAKNEENYITFSKEVVVDWFTKEIIKKDEDGKEVGRHKKKSWLKGSCGLSIHTDLCLPASMI